MDQKKKRERHNCCVPQCSAVKTETNHMHTVPRDPERLKKWKIAIKTGKPLTPTMQVCSRHFKPEDYIPTRGLGLKPNLKKTAVPSMNLPVRALDKSTPSPVKRKRLARQDRAAKRALWTEDSTEDSTDDKTSSDTNNNDSVADNQEGWENVPDSHDIPQQDRKILKDAEIQVDFDSKFVESILSSDKKLFTATGLHSVKLLTSLTKNFEKIAPESIFRNFAMPTRDRIILTMMRIKLSLSFCALSVLFDLNYQTCANYFYDSVVILARILQCMIFWPGKEDILKNMPKCFSQFKSTRVVLDCYEIPITRPKCITCRVRTYSHYKKGFTAKISMNITPSGLISHCSAAFGGRASDKVITAHTGIYDMCDPLDGIMVDKGYAIDEECQDRNLTLIRPPFLRKSKKFSRAEAVRCAKIARARVHVERVIQRVRGYLILKNKIPWHLVPFLDDIVVIVSALVNLGKPILAKDKY